MSIDSFSFKSDEKVIPVLRSLYENHGYSQYKMSKFEEYDLYVRNKDFLVSDSVITFTDTNGRLMALKPDVTLSIIKNSKDIPGFVQKVYYNENVYRISKGTHSFKEIMQTGLECMGDIDDYCIYEVLKLAAMSLLAICDDCVLDVSHLGVLSLILESLSLSKESAAEIIKCIGEKSAHEISRVCRENYIDSEKEEKIKKLVSLYGKPDDVIPELKKLLGENGDTSVVDSLERIFSAFTDEKLKDIFRIDFSVVNDMKYYNGFVFKGFVKGVPNSVLSGGQYDNMMQRMKKKSGAIGFAVYIDMIERLYETAEKYDIDTVVLYDDGADIKALSAALEEIRSEGNTAAAQRKLPEKLKYRRLLKFENGEVTILENNA